VTWNVALSKRAENQLAKIRGTDLNRLVAAIDQLAKDPRSGDMKAMQGKHRGRFRRRVENWRLIFTINDGILLV
jgi:mRNA interferase RelE/StbE